MKTQAIRAADIQLKDGIPFSPEFGDVYHPAAGPAAQARHVFLGGNGLPARWAGRDRFVILEAGFGLGNNFLATWDAWRRDEARCRRLVFVSIERHPPSRQSLRELPRDESLRPLAEELESVWPPLTPNLHRLLFEGGRVELLLAFGDIASWLPEIVARVDAFYLDGFAPARNPQMWDARLFKAMARLAAPDATAATWSVARMVREGLRTAGFEVDTAAGSGGKRDITVARYAPRFQPRRAPARLSPPCVPANAMIVGAGLAGCAAAWALARQGIRSTVLDRNEALASEASGNPAGLFHGIVNPQDGAHARFNRAAALETERVVRRFLSQRPGAGAVEGLLRLETASDVGRMREVLRQQGLPAEYIQAVDAREASELAGIALDRPAWHYPGGGWLRPAELARWFLDDAGDMTRFIGGVDIRGIRRAGSQWLATDASGETVAEADSVVLANAASVEQLLGDTGWPIERVRGQLSIANAAELPHLPRIPVAGSGYLLPDVDGRVIFGATVQPGVDDPDCRDADHRHNLAQLASLLGRSVGIEPGSLTGRVGWRWATDDRLPIVGAIPDIIEAGTMARLDQARFVPRVEGLYVLTGLASRGITWCSLCAQVLASAISGAPAPLEASLLDAIDPARFLVRSVRRASPSA